EQRRELLVRPREQLGARELEAHEDRVALRRERRAHEAVAARAHARELDQAAEAIAQARARARHEHARARAELVARRALALERGAGQELLEQVAHVDAA